MEENKFKYYQTSFLSSSLFIIFFTLTIILLISYIFNKFFAYKISKKSEKKSEKKIKNNENVFPFPSLTSTSSSKGSINKKFSHKYLAAILKSHKGFIQDVSLSVNNKYLVSTDDDRVIYVWLIKDYLNHNNKSIRVNVDFDFASKICFSPDNKAFLTFLKKEKIIRIFKMVKSEQNKSNIKFIPGLEFPNTIEEEVLNLLISNNGLFIIITLFKPIIKIFDIKGLLLEVLETHQVHHNHSIISHCSKFLACSGFTPEVKVWEIEFDKSNNHIKPAVKVFQLSSHTSSILSFDFNQDSKRAVTLSKDNTWKLWDIDIDYKKKQDPILIKTWSCDFPISTNYCSSFISISPSGLSVVIATNNKYIYIYNYNDNNYQVIEDDELNGIKRVIIEREGLYFIIIGQKIIHIFHNVQELKGLIYNYEEKIKMETISKLMKKRLKDLIINYQIKLSNLGFEK